MDYNHIHRKEPKYSCQWIFWYGDFLLSEVEYTSIISFEKGIKIMEEKIKNGQQKSFIEAVIQVSKVKLLLKYIMNKNNY